MWLFVVKPILALPQLQPVIVWHAEIDLPCTKLAVFLVGFTSPCKPGYITYPHIMVLVKVSLVAIAVMDLGEIASYFSTLGWASPTRRMALGLGAEV